MATSSFIKDFVIEDEKEIEKLLNAIEKPMDVKLVELDEADEECIVEMFLASQA